MDSFPLTRAEEKGIEEQRRLKAAVGSSERTRTDIIWTWHGAELDSIKVEHRVLLGRAEK